MRVSAFVSPVPEDYLSFDNNSDMDTPRKRLTASVHAKVPVAIYKFEVELELKSSFLIIYSHRLDKYERENVCKI